MMRVLRRRPRKPDTRSCDPTLLAFPELNDHLLRDIGFVRTERLRCGVLVRPYGP